MNDASPTLPAVGTAENPVLAAGVVLWTGTPTEPRFLLMQNAQHGTWSFAKGHLETGESVLTGALREVEEETGLCLTPDALDSVFADTSIYQPNDQDWKRVVYYLAQNPVEENALQVSQEHQAVAWLDKERAVEILGFSDLRRTLLRAATRLCVLAETQV